MLMGRLASTEMTGNVQSSFVQAQGAGLTEQRQQAITPAVAACTNRLNATPAKVTRDERQRPAAPARKAPSVLPKKDCEPRCQWKNAPNAPNVAARNAATSHGRGNAKWLCS